MNAKKKKITLKDTLQAIKIILIVCLVMYIFVYFVTLFGINETKDIFKKSKTTVGRIEKIIYEKGPKSLFEFYVNDKEYNAKGNYIEGFTQIGEFYIVFYDSLDPSRNYVDFVKPIFITTQKTEFTNAKIISYNPPCSDFWGNPESPDCEFEYWVEGRKYKRFQYLDDSIVVNEGKTYTVEYLIEQPRISILFSDERITPEFARNARYKGKK